MSKADAKLGRGFFEELSQLHASAGPLRTSEQWRREFLIAPVLTSPWGLNLQPWDIRCEVAFRLSKTQRDEIRTGFGKAPVRVRPDYIVCPQEDETVALLVEAKKQLNRTDPLKPHSEQVLLEQKVTRSPWTIITDGVVWLLLLKGKPILFAESIIDLGNGIRKWQQLVGRDVLQRTGSNVPSLLQVLMSGGESIDGKEPTLNDQKQLAGLFPRLASDGFRVVAEPTLRYNCLSAVVGDRGRWWWPELYAFWPSGVPREHSLLAIRDALVSLGFSECSHEALQSGLDKIVLFGKAGEPTHATFQTRSGLWVSKLGKLHEVLHDLYALEGEAYGEPVFVLARQRSLNDFNQPARTYSATATRPRSR